MLRKSLTLLLAVIAFALPCRADELNFDKEFSAVTDAVPDDVAKLLPANFFDGVDEAAEGLDEVLETSFWRKLVKTAFSETFGEIGPALLSILGILILSAFLHVFKDSLQSESVSVAVNLAVTVVVLSILMKYISIHVELVVNYVKVLSDFSLAMLPLMGALLATGGSGGAAVAMHGGVLMTLGVVEAVVGEAFGGIVGVSVAMTAANIFSGRFRLAAPARAIRRCFGIFFGIVSGMLGLLFSVKLGIAAAADSTAMRGAKMFASNAIPIVGSTIGDSFRTLATAVSYIKSVSGTVGIVLILILALPVFINVWLFRSGLILLSGAAEMLGCERERELLAGMISVYGYILAVLAIVTVVFVFMLTLFMKSTLAFGGSV